MMNAPNEHGFALITAIVLLIALTLIGTVAMRSAGFELRMSENQLQRVEAFENSELPRQQLGDIVDQHALARGWPVARGGVIPPADFRFDIPDTFDITGLDTTNADKPSWYVGNIECGTQTRCALPASNDLETKARFARQLPTGVDKRSRDVSAALGVFKLRTDLNPGSGTAMVAGYEGTGRSVASGGARILFHVESRSASTRAVRTAADSDTAGRAVTAATFRHVVRN